MTEFVLLCELSH